MSGARLFPREVRAKDWCHICGERRWAMADLWFPRNAEHCLSGEPSAGKDRYVRICESCGERIMLAAQGSSFDPFPAPKGAPKEPAE